MSKPASKDLFELISSMSKGEKKHFKLFISKETDSLDTNIIRLFNLINSSSEYDEQKIIQSGKIKGNFPALKHYLYDMIMKSLLIYHAEDSSSIRIKNLISFAHILRHKRLYKQCYSTLDKAFKLAEKTENYVAWIEIANLYDTVASDQLNLGILEERINTHPMEKQMIRKLENLQEYKWLQQKMRVLHLKNTHAITEETQNQSEQIIKLPLIKNSSLAQSIHASLYLNSIKIIYYWSLGDFANTMKHALTNVKLYDTTKGLIEDEPIEYLQKLITLLLVQGRLEEDKGLCQTIAKARGLLSNNRVAPKLKGYEGLIYTYTYSAEVNLQIKRRQFKKAKLGITQLLSEIKSNHIDLPVRQMQPIYYNMACIHFYMGEYKEANHWINKVLTIGFNERTDVEYFSRIIGIISSFELRDEDYMVSSIQKLKRYASRFNQYPVFTESFIKTMYSMQKVTGEKNDKKEWLSLKKGLLDLNPKEKILLQYLYLDEWVNKTY